jgi:hypothetical protein
MRIRSASNSATMANTLNSSLPTGSVGSYTDAPKMSLTFAAGEFVEDVARVGQRPGQPIKLGHHNASPLWQAAEASRRPDRSRFVPVRPRST